MNINRFSKLRKNHLPYLAVLFLMLSYLGLDRAFADATHRDKGNEIKSKRTLYSKMYQHSGNTFTLEIFNSPVHYRDRSGKWQDLDYKIKSLADTAWFTAEMGLYHAKYRKHLGNDFQVEVRIPDRQMTGVSFKLTRMGYFTQGGNEFHPLEDIRPAEGQAGSNRVIYPGIFTGVDLRLTGNPDILKQDIVLTQQGRDSLPAPQSLSLNQHQTMLAFEFEFDPDSSLWAYADTTRINRNRVFNFTGTRPISFRNKKGKKKFSFPLDRAYSAAALDTSSEPYSTEVFRRFSTVGKRHFILVGVPYNWLAEAPQGTIIIDPSVEIQSDGDDGKDAYLYKSRPGDNYGASGAMQVGPDGGSSERRSLIRFSLPGLPQNSEITDAELSLFVSYSWGNTNTFEIDAHRMLREWAEGDGISRGNNSGLGCDWNYADQEVSSQWNSAGMASGSDFSSSIIDTVIASNTDSEVWKTWDIQDAVQYWVDNPNSNHGLALVTAGADMNDVVGTTFFSSDYTTDPSLRPKLTITFTVDPLVTYEYNAAGLPSSVTYGNGVVETNEYGTRDWLVSRDYQNGGTNVFYIHSDQTDDYDYVGNLLEQRYKHNTGSELKMEYGYDPLNRLDSFKYQGNLERSYAYDECGNFLSFAGRSFTYRSGSDWLTSDGNRSFTYDANGSVDSIDGTSLSYDIFRNMTSYGNDHYSYDDTNGRIKKIENSETRYYISNNGATLSEYGENDSLEAEYIYGPSGMVAKLRPDFGYIWYYKDHLGSTRQMSEGNMERDYYPFGESKVASGDESAYQYSGKERDANTGLDYFGARYYDASIGRWLSVDPLHQDYSPYTYTGDNPVSRVDLNGNYWFGIYSGAAAVLRYPSVGALSIEATNWVPLAGLIMNGFRRLGFGDKTISGIDWAMSIIPFDRYFKIFKSFKNNECGGFRVLWTAMSVSPKISYSGERLRQLIAGNDLISQTFRDYRIFALAVALGYGKDISTSGFGVLILSRKFLESFESSEDREAEFAAMNDFFRLNKDDFISNYGKDKYNTYSKAMDQSEKPKNVLEFDARWYSSGGNLLDPYSPQNR